MRVVHLFREALEQGTDVGGEVELVGGFAKGVAGGGVLAEVVVGGAKAVDGVAQEAAVEEEITGRLRDRVVDLMAREGLDVRMAIEVIDDVGLFDAAVAVVGVEAGEALAEVTVEDVLERGAGVFQDVVVQDDEAQS